MAPVPVEETCLCYQYSHEYKSKEGDNILITINNTKLEEVYVGLTHMFAPTTRRRHYNRNLHRLRGGGEGGGSQQQQQQQKQYDGRTMRHRSLLTEATYENDDGVLIRTKANQSYRVGPGPYHTSLKFGIVLEFCAALEVEPHKYLLEIHDNFFD